MAIARRRRIAVVPGDGIGIEVLSAQKQVLALLDQRRHLGLELVDKDWGAERWLKEKVGLPKGALEDLREHYDAVTFGALGDPRIPDMAHGREILLGMRQGLDLYANMRPIRCLDDGLSPLKGKGEREIDFVCFRENTEDMYVSLGGVFKQGTEDEVAQDISINTKKGVERVIRHAFEYARKTGRPRVTMCDKHNAIRFGGGLWKRTFDAVSTEYSTIAADHLFVDVAAMEFVRKPERFSVVVCNNLFGDILTDLGAALGGGLGLAASANIHPGRIGLFEPVHGSAPDIAGKGIANPLASFLTASLMLDFLEAPAEARVIDDAVRACIKRGPKTPDMGGAATTAAITDFVLAELVAALG
jgi:3-isopropylmalate dehydrogenase